MPATAHFPFKDELKSCLLFIIHFPCYHSAENIKLTFDDLVSEKGLQVFVYVTDNGSNIKKAFQARVFFSNDKAAIDQTLKLFHETGVIESKSDILDNDDNDDEIACINTKTNFQSGMRCCAHTLQLVVDDGL